MAYILIADDDPLIGEVVSTILMDEGHIVGSVNNGQLALSTMRQRPPQLAILDQNMPVMNGRSVLRQMRLDVGLVMVPVMMLTGISGREDEKISFYDGADHYMTKPFDPDELIFWAEELIAMRVKRTMAKF